MNKQEFIKQISEIESKIISIETKIISIETKNGDYDCEIWLDEEDDNCWFSEMLGNTGYRDLESISEALWDYIVEEEKSEIISID